MHCHLLYKLQSPWIKGCMMPIIEDEQVCGVVDYHFLIETLGDPLSSTWIASPAYLPYLLPALCAAATAFDLASLSSSQLSLSL